MNRTVFLDIDGVLNSTRSSLAFGRGMLLPQSRVIDPRLDPVAVGLVRRLVEEAGAEIVITSSWRNGCSLNDFHEVFDQYNWNTRHLIKSVTPDINYKSRGLEIDTWLNNTGGQLVFRDYVIIDDENMMLDYQIPRFVKVTGLNGFSVRNFIKAKQIFGISDAQNRRKKVIG